MRKLITTDERIKNLKVFIKKRELEIAGAIKQKQSAEKRLKILLSEVS